MRERDRDDIPAFLKQKGYAMQNLSEQNIRRLAKREGYSLHKSRCRNPDQPGYGGYMLTDSTTSVVMLGGGPAFPYSADLEEISDWLTSPE